MSGRPADWRPRIRTSLAGVRWPPVPNAQAATLLSLLDQFRESQWWAPEEIERCQFVQLEGLLKHAYDTIPFYRERFEAAGLTPPFRLDEAAWKRVPVLTRRDLQQRQLRSERVPPGHGRVYLTQTSGSTGEPVKLHGTDLNQLFWRAHTLRDHEWHRRDFGGRLASIRALSGGRETRVDSSWGIPVDLVYRSGPSGLMSLTTDVSRQLEWLAEFNPTYLLTFPSNLAALIDHSRAAGVRLPALREVRSMSETVTDRLREACRAQWGVPLTDSYSSQEAGYIALQCPDHPPRLHVQSENVRVEVVNEAGDPCRPGEVGRVLLTSLHNFATPIIRYELRDRAEAGGVCPCGRGLPVIHRVLGRERNMLRLPNGEQRWPMTGYQQYGAIAPAVIQFQMVQHTLAEIEVRLAVTRPLEAAEQEALRRHIQDSLGHPFEIVLTFHDVIPRSSGGKFEEFISEVA